MGTGEKGRTRRAHHTSSGSGYSTSDGQQQQPPTICHRIQDTGRWGHPHGRGAPPTSRTPPRETLQQHSPRCSAVSVGPFPLGLVLGSLDRVQPLWGFFPFFISLPLIEKRKRSQGMPRETQEFELTSPNHSAAPKWVSLQAALCYSSPTQYPHPGEMMEPDARSRACRKTLPG